MDLLFQHSQPRAHKPLNQQLRYRTKGAPSPCLQGLRKNFLLLTKLMSEEAKAKGKHKMTWKHQIHQTLGTLEGRDNISGPH